MSKVVLHLITQNYLDIYLVGLVILKFYYQLYSTQNYIKQYKQ